MLIQRDKDWVEVAQELYKTQTAKRKWAEKEEELRDKLKLLSDNKPAQGGRFLWLCDTAKGTVNYKLIPELQEVDLDEYRNGDIQRWKLSKV